MTTNEYREREAVYMLLALHKITARQARFILQVIDNDRKE